MCVRACVSACVCVCCFGHRRDTDAVDVPHLSVIRDAVVGKVKLQFLMALIISFQFSFAKATVSIMQ